ncbi:Ig-like domain-containing protein [Neolewinella litorea]|uniref:T9SS type A sorting domain-containing protein n=1 Tax=Neolewinella litorea TaxID=2562452 RepID=A0A4S4N932_9BACT|nr:Ig-like domain-containing protein [Neolewinella litorea]THH34578.1 T9SS type A sorting domain-containing protein [Neolewinella litorea]
MKHVFYLCLLLPSLLLSQVTDNDGDWAEHYVTLSNTPEAELMVRTGDIDNLGFGWPADFDPFSGNSTSAHAFPWTVDPVDPAGTDRIMVISSYVGTPPNGNDGYTSTTSRPDNDVQGITLTFETDLTISAATLQFFVDDFQAPVWNANYVVFLDGVRASGLEAIVNDLQQTGPIGKIITYSIPNELLYLLDDGSLMVVFDDFTTGAGDGYAIDFAKLLINPSEDVERNATLTGQVTDANDNSPLEGVIVRTTNNLSDTTDAAGYYTIENLSPGINQLTTFAPGYGAATQSVDIAEDQTLTVNFALDSPAPVLTFLSPAHEATQVDTSARILLVFDQEMDAATFNTSSLVLTGNEQNVPGTFTTSGDTLVFLPERLDSSTTYSLTITSALRNTLGVRLEEDLRFSFSTGEASTAVGSRPSVPVFNVFPNPLQDNLLRLTAPIGTTAFRIYNRTGQVIQSGAYQPSLRLSADLSPGIYYLQLLDRTDRPVGIARFVR